MGLLLGLTQNHYDLIKVGDLWVNVSSFHTLLLVQLLVTTISHDPVHYLSL